MRYVILIAGLAGFSACTAVAPNDGASGAPAATATALPAAGPLRIGNGYRNVDDPCRRTGVNAVTAPFAAVDSDLVSCPVDFDGRPAFIRATRAREVTRTEDWVVYSVPLFGDALVTQIPVAPPLTGG